MRLDSIIYLTFAGAGLVMLLPREAKNLIRWTALLTGVVGLLIGLWGCVTYTGPGFVHLVDVPWIPSLGVHYHLAVDGLNLPLVLLNGIVCVTGILFSWNIEERVKEFFTRFLAAFPDVQSLGAARETQVLKLWEGLG